MCDMSFFYSDRPIRNILRRKKNEKTKGWSLVEGGG